MGHDYKRAKFSKGIPHKARGRSRNESSSDCTCIIRRCSSATSRMMRCEMAEMQPPARVGFVRYFLKDCCASLTGRRHQMAWYPNMIGVAPKIFRKPLCQEFDERL